jgi:hypothetical protein
MKPRKRTAENFFLTEKCPKLFKVFQTLGYMCVDRNTLNYLLRRYVKPVFKMARCPLSVIDVNMDLESNISSLHAVKGAENLPLTNSMKMPGHPKGTTKANIVKEKKEKAHCKAEIAKVYNQKMNEVKADGLTRVPRVYLKTLIHEKKKTLAFCAVLHFR